MKETQKLIDSQEFVEWIALYGIEPWGDDWEQADLIACLMANINRRKGSKAFKRGDFIHRPLKKKRKQTQQEIAGVMKSLCNATQGIRING